MTMKRAFSKWLVAAGLVAVGTPAQAAHNIDCMDSRFGEVEHLVLDRMSALHRGDVRLDNAVDQIIEARGQVCKYLYGWSDAAVKAAVQYRQWQLIADFFDTGSILTADHQARLDAALEPRRSQFLALFTSAIIAQQGGAAAPPPPVDMFRDFGYVIKDANIPDTPKARAAVDGWLYIHGMLQALAAAFATD